MGNEAIVFAFPTDITSVSCKGFSKELLPILIRIFNKNLHIVEEAGFCEYKFTKIEWAGVIWIIEETAEFVSLVTAVSIMNGSLTDEEILFNILKN